MAKVLKQNKQSERFVDQEFDKVLEVPLKNGTKLPVVRFIKKAGNTTVYCNRHPECSWEIFAKYFSVLQDYQQNTNEDEDIEFDV